jgi:hypothetical protein
MTTITTSTASITPLQAVTLDLYRDIHKGIRTELFAVTEGAGRADPGDAADRAALAQHVRTVRQLLISHAEHEDGAIQPVLAAELPSLAARIEVDHEVLEARLAGLEELAGTVEAAGTGSARRDLHQLYLELGSFTSAYLEHQDVEERVVMPALEAAVGVEACVGIHQAIVGSIPPEELARTMAIMIPAMNVDDRTELLGGMQQGAPAEVFAGVWSLVGSVLPASDHAALATRLGIS